MSIKLGVFISGTDTGVGKTLVSSLLLSSLRTYGIRSGYFKPVQTGSDLDSETVARYTGVPFTRFPQPVYQFPEPISPHRAAKIHESQIQLDQIQKQWHSLEDRAWVVEGAGGLLVPLNATQTIRDLVSALSLKLVIVASTRLGTINHTLLTLEAAKAAQLNVAGIVLVGSEDEGLEAVFSELTETPVIARVPFFETLSSTWVQEKGVSFFPAALLRKLFE